MNDLAVANTILEQLGGRQFIAMTGANGLIGTNNSLSFRLPDRFAKSRINMVRIELEPSDTYTITFGRVWGTRYAPFEAVLDVYAEDLRRIFTDRTGLDCTLGTMHAES